MGLEPTKVLEVLKIFRICAQNLNFKEIRLNLWSVLKISRLYLKLRFVLNTFWTKIPKSSHSDAYCYIQSTYILLAWSSSILEARWSGSCFSNRSSSGEVGNTVFDLTETSMYVLQKFWHVVNYLYVGFNWNINW